MGKVREDKFEANFDDKQCYDDTDVGFDVDFGNEVEDCGAKDGD